MSEEILKENIKNIEELLMASQEIVRNTEEGKAFLEACQQHKEAHQAWFNCEHKQALAKAADLMDSTKDAVYETKEFEYQRTLVNHIIDMKKIITID